MREDFEKRSNEMVQKFEKKMKEEREILELRRRTEIHEIEERKNGQIHALMKNHEKSFRLGSDPELTRRIQNNIGILYKTPLKSSMRASAPKIQMELQKSTCH